jgi:hypothetical protein
LITYWNKALMVEIHVESLWELKEVLRSQAKDREKPLGDADS